MRRILLLLPPLIVTAGASPPRPLPVPPLPPVNAPTDQSAPLPDRNVQGPSVLEPGTRVMVEDFRVRRFKQGMGYTPGSQFESSEDKRSIQTPGLSVRVPLQ